MYVCRSCASVWRANWPQAGHWKSAYSSIVTGAVAEPRTWPACAMPGAAEVDGDEEASLPNQMRTATTAIDRPLATTSIVRRGGAPRRAARADVRARALAIPA